jgi:tetratricopeptide (TPR) repeat protein
MLSVLLLALSSSVSAQSGPGLSPDERRAVELIANADRAMGSRPPDFSQASLYLRQALDLAPENPSAYNKLATAYNNLKNYSGAVEAAMKSLEITGGFGAENRNPAAYENLAWAQLNLGDARSAVSNASVAVQQNPRSAMAYAVRAFAYEELGERERMLESIEIAAGLSRAFHNHLQRARSGKRIFRRRGAAKEKSSSGEGLGKDILSAIGVALLISGGLFWWIWDSRRKQTEQSEAARAEREREKASGAQDDDDGPLAGKYKLSRIIGKGGMGQVWEAQDVSLGRVVAIKRMTDDLDALGEKGREYYMMEARTVAALHHPHIIGIYEILDLPVGLFLVFEMARGKTVQHLLAEKHNLPLSEAVSILRPVCEALEFAHARGVVHRDLKPANIMLTDQGFVKVMDFGIARKVNTTVDTAGAGESGETGGLQMDHTRTIVGTPVYMAPEAEQGAVGAVSDVFSLGVCLYEMVTGRLPYDARGGMALKLERQYIPASQHDGSIPATVDALIADALHPNPEHRVPSARDFRARLDQLGSTAGVRGV